MFAALIVGHQLEPCASGMARQTGRRQRMNRRTGRPTLDRALLTETVLFAARQIGRNLGPVIELLALVLARAIVHAPHPFGTTFWCNGPEGGRLGDPTQAMRIDHVQAERGRALDLGAIHFTARRAQAQGIAFVVKLLARLIHLALVLALGFTGRRLSR